MAVAYEPEQLRPKSGTQRVILDPLTGPVDRTFKISGLSECIRVTIEVIDDATGMVVYGPKPAAADGIDLGTEYFFQEEITLLANYNSVTVKVYCVRPTDGDSITGLKVQNAVSTTEHTDLPGPGPKRLKFTFKLNNWKGSQQSTVLVVYGRLPDNTRIKYGHIFSECPPPTVTYDFGFVDPGLYIAQFTFIDGQTSVTTVTARKLLN